MLIVPITVQQSPTNKAPSQCGQIFISATLFDTNYPSIAATRVTRPGYRKRISLGSSQSAAELHLFYKTSIFVLSDAILWVTFARDRVKVSQLSMMQDTRWAGDPFLTMIQH